MSDYYLEKLELVQYYVDQGNYPQAAITLKSLLKEDPDHAALYHCRLGCIHSIQGRFKQAIRDMVDCLKSLTPHQGSVKADVLMRKAVECYDDVLKLNSDFEDAKNDRKRINSSRTMLSQGMPSHDTSEFLCVDPSCFLSSSSIDGLVKALLILGKDDKLKNAKIVIPSLLYEGLTNMIEQKKFSTIIKIFQTWVPGSHIGHIKALVRGLSINKKYIGTFRIFRFCFSPTEVKESTIQTSSYLTELKDKACKKYGKVVGKIVYEELWQSVESKAKIITFDDKGVIEDIAEKLEKQIVKDAEWDEKKRPIRNIKKYSIFEKLKFVVVLRVGNEANTGYLRDEGINIAEDSLKNLKSCQTGELIILKINNE